MEEEKNRSCKRDRKGERRRDSVSVDRYAVFAAASRRCKEFT